MAWYDPINKALTGFTGSKSVAPTATAGSSADDINGFATGYPSSREKSYRLRGIEKYRTYQDIVTNTMIVAAGVRYFLNLLSNSQWTFECAKDEDGEDLPGAPEVAKFFEEVFNDMNTPWSKVVRRAARFRFHGFSWQEWTAKKREDGMIGLLDVEPRPCVTIERWDLDANNRVQGVTQRIAGASEVYLPRAKALYLVDDVLEDCPEGIGLLRHTVRQAERLRAFEELEELAFETDLRGTPIGRVPLKEMRDQVKAGSMTKDAVAKARKAIDDFVRNKLANRNKGLVLDSEVYQGTTVDGNTSPSSTYKWSVDTLKQESRSQTEVANAINRINRELAQLLGIEHLLLGSDGTGSLALIGGKLSSFFLVVSSTQNEIAQGVKSDLVAPVGLLNGIPKELWPTPKPQEIDVNDVEAVAQVLQSLATAGATLQPDDPAVDVVRSRAGLPPAPPPPELDEADQALVDRMRAGLPVNVDPKDPEQEDDVEPGAGNLEAQAAVNKLLHNILKEIGRG